MNRFFHKSCVVTLLALLMLLGGAGAAAAFRFRTKQEAAPCSRRTVPPYCTSKRPRSVLKFTGSMAAGANHYAWKKLHAHPAAG